MSSPLHFFPTSLLAIVALAGCASSHRAATSVASPYLGAPITLHAAPGVHAQAASRADDSLQFINARRAEVGLPPIADDRDVAAAAAAHAHYLRLNGAHGHDELASAQGFTGADVTSRVRRHTAVYGASEVLSVFGGVRRPEAAIAEIFASPYHRGAIFFDWARAGEAVDGPNAGITVIDFADIAPALGDTELVAYPYDGQTDAPVSWTNIEQPDPMGANSGYFGAVVGYPVTLSGGPNAHIDLTTLTLTDERGNRVACRLAPSSVADTGRNTAVCTPYQPLEAGVRYLVRATGFVTQLSPTRAPFDLRWTFRTSRLNVHPEDERQIAARSGSR